MKIRDMKGTIGGLTIVAGALVWLAHEPFAATAAEANAPSGPGFRRIALPPALGPERVGFHRLPGSESGLTFTNRLPVERFTTNQIYLNGSGVAAGDVDGDGRCDVFLAGLGGGSALFRNEGSWHFRDVTAESGAGLPGLDASGVALVDFDGDGDPDLIVNTVGGGTQVLLNDGRGRFTRLPPLNPGRCGTSLALGDLDGDGWLDLYVANYRPNTLRDQPRTNFRIQRVNGEMVVALVNGQPTTSPELAGRFTYQAGSGITEHGEPHALFRNDGRGGFVAQSFTNGLFLDASGQRLPAPLNDWGLTVLIRDFNGDLWPDIYVCNDFISEDRFWLNQGGGRFRAAPAIALRNTCKFSMGADTADVDRDGHPDLFVLDMLSRHHATRLTRMDRAMDPSPIGAVETRLQLGRNTFHLARGDGTYAEAAYQFGLEASEWSWSPVFLDVDLDGYEDLLVSAGHARDDMHADYGMRIEALRRSRQMTTPEELSLRTNTPPIASAKLAFRNVGGRRFEETARTWGFADPVGVAHGMCLADLDGDGDLDVVVNHLNGEAGLYRNESTAPRVAVRLRGRAPNTSGVGARIRLRGGAVDEQSQEIIAGGRYLSSDQPVRVFAVGDGSRGSGRKMTLTVDWRSGARSVIERVLPQSIYEIDEPQSASGAGSAGGTGAGALPVAPLAAAEPSANDAAIWFVDESRRLGHRHFELAFDDFARQPLLPHRLSQAGPGVGMMDVDGDGTDDLVLGSGRKGRPGLFLNSGQGGFRVVEPAATEADLVAVCGLPLPGGATRALVARSTWEQDDPAAAGAILRLAPDGALASELELPALNPGPLAAGDADGDGVPDLFVGGGAKPGRYPEAGASHVFLRRGDSWLPSAEWDRALAEAGLVRGALWSDLDGDGAAELVLACEWGPVRILRRDGGSPTPRDVTEAWGLAGLTGWWTGVAAGDFDGDGRQDLVVGNWGLNSKYRASAERPRRLLHGDPGGQGQVDLLEAYFDPESNRWVPERELMAVANSQPWLREKFPTFQAFANAGLDDILGEQRAAWKPLEARTLATTMFLNRGGRFEAVPLGDEAQRSVVWGVNVADFDGDGAPDLFLAQNFFPVAGVTARNDAGRGLVLRGDGHGGFSPQPGRVTGIAAYGESRGSAVGDFDGDGRPDLVVTQNGAETKLYRNRTGPEGIRVRLRGLAGNPAALGAVLRMKNDAGNWGAARELRAGSGYASQDSLTCVFPRPARGSAMVQVRWPGGKVLEYPLPADARTVLLEQPSAEAK